MPVCTDAWSPANSCHRGRPASKCPAHCCKASASTRGMGTCDSLAERQLPLILGQVDIAAQTFTAFDVRPKQ